MSIRFLPAALIAVFIALVAVGGAALAFGRDGADSEEVLNSIGGLAKSQVEQLREEGAI